MNLWLNCPARALVLPLALTAAQVTRAFAASDLQNAAEPLEAGVPQVAIVRLQQLLRSDLPQPERRIATLKLAQALIAAEQTSDALNLLTDPAIADVPEAKFFSAQAHAARGEWTEALAQYRQCSADPASPFRSEAR